MSAIPGSQLTGLKVMFRDNKQFDTIKYKTRRIRLAPFPGRQTRLLLPSRKLYNLSAGCCGTENRIFNVQNRAIFPIMQIKFE